MKQKSQKKGFTLIELLVVIAIIGILATIAIISLQQARQNARDAKRIADVKQMQTALELYFNDNQQYPASTSLITSIASGSNVYMAILPEAPTPADGNCQTASNTYTYSEQGVDNGSYILSFCLGKQTGGLTAGPKCATPGGILNADCSGGVVVYNDGGEDGGGDFSGDSGTFTDSRDSNEYDWVKIGDQIWMKENLKYLPQVSNNNNFLNCASEALACAGVYGYDGNDVVTAKALPNYSTYGVLYNWDAAQAPTCPSGWRVPSDSDFATLANYIDFGNYSSWCGPIGDPSDCGGAWSNAGNYLKNDILWNGINSYNFSGLPAGERNAIDGDFSGEGGIGRFWTTNSLLTNGIYYGLDSSMYNNALVRSSHTKGQGLSIRCIKN